MMDNPAIDAPNMMNASLVGSILQKIRIGRLYSNNHIYISGQRLETNYIEHIVKRNI